jgi:hypothetical protein
LNLEQQQAVLAQQMMIGEEFGFQEQMLDFQLLVPNLDCLLPMLLDRDIEMPMRMWILGH